jgi:hypothetical protein
VRSRGCWTRPGGLGLDENQRWTLARISGLVWCHALRRTAAEAEQG